MLCGRGDGRSDRPPDSATGAVGAVRPTSGQEELGIVCERRDGIGNEADDSSIELQEINQREAASSGSSLSAVASSHAPGLALLVLNGGATS